MPPFQVVVERHGPALLRFCRARLGVDRGEEAFQDTLLAALRAYDTVREPEAVAGWLFVIARRKVVDAVRDRAARPLLDAERAAEIPAPPAPDADHGLWAQVATLPPKQREAVGLRYLADLSHADVAQVMGTSVEAARRNVHEGLKRLRKDLADEHPRG